MEKSYRRNVAIVVVNDFGQVLACQRSDIPEAWQIPQGGIEAGETDEAAMMRELLEEIGTNEVQIIGKLPESICYDWPEELYHRGFHGQEQTYYLVRLKNGVKLDPSTASSGEFQQFEWVNVQELLGRCTGFKTEAYRLALQQMKMLYPKVISCDNDQ